jgi:hypothetical protein
MFSHMFLLILVTTFLFSVFLNSLLTDFFTPFLATQESNFLSRFLYHWHSELVCYTCAPIFLAQKAWVPQSKTLVGTW